MRFAVLAELRLIADAESRGLHALYLLTQTAEHYFPKFGFERIPREAVPPEVAGPLSEYARAIGRPKLAEDLAAAARPERPDGASGVSPRAPSP